MRQGYVDEHAFRFGDAITHGKIGKKTVETCGNSVQSKISEAALGVIKSLTD